VGLKGLSKAVLSRRAWFDDGGAAILEASIERMNCELETAVSAEEYGSWGEAIELLQYSQHIHGLADLATLIARQIRLK